MTNAPPIAAAATVLLHAALLAAVAAGLHIEPKAENDSEPLKVQLIPPQPIPPAVIQPAPPAPTVNPVRQKRYSSKPRKAPPAPPQATTATPAPVQAPQASPDTKPVPVAAQPAPAAPSPPSPPAAPVRTSASEASYASTNRTPPYPRISLSNGEEGTVVLRVLVTAEGTAGAVEIKSSSGYPLLDESARRTVQTWRFKPATADGKPVAEWYQVPIPFKLQNN